MTLNGALNRSFALLISVMPAYAGGSQSLLKKMLSNITRETPIISGAAEAQPLAETRGSLAASTRG